MQTHDPKQITLSNVRILFRNFAGRAREFNSEGDRNFNVILDPETAEKMKADGWRVKQLPERDEEPGDYILKVKLNFNSGKPPRVVMVTSNNHTELGINTENDMIGDVSLLDSADLKKVDLVINGWWSDMAGGGYSGYLKTMFAFINEDALELKYAGYLADNGDLKPMNYDEEPTDGDDTPPVEDY